MKRYLFTLLVIVLGVFGHAQDSTKVKRSLLWKISGNGLSSPSYLYGTMHVSNKVAFHLSSDFFSAIQSVDAIALESDPSTWMERFIESGNIYSDYGWQILANNGGDFYERSFTNTSPEKNEIRALMAFQPMLANHILYRAGAYQMNFEEDTYLDMFIYQTGMKAGKPVHALENDEKVDSLMNLANNAEPDKKEYRYDSPNSELDDLETLYRKGEVDLLLEKNRESWPSEEFGKYFIFERNKLMVDSALVLLKKKSLFIGVGAAHLSGEEGMIELFRKAGYQVEPIYGKVTSKSIKTKNKLQARLRPRELATYTPQDQSWSLQVPEGQMFDLHSENNLTLYTCPDVVNGTFISLLKVNTNPSLISYEDFISRVDSAVLEMTENVLKRDRRIENGNPVWEMTTRTARGNLTYYKLIATQHNLWVLKLIGTGKYVETKQARAIAASLTIASQFSPAGTYTTGFGEISLEIPAPYRLSYLGKPHKKREKWTQLDAFDNKGHFYNFIKITLQDYDYIEEDSFELETFRDYLIENSGDSLLNSVQDSYQGFNSIHFSYVHDSLQVVRSRIILRGGHYYGLFTNDTLSNFENSLKILPFDYPEAKDYTDTLLGISTKLTIAPPSGQDRKGRSVRPDFHPLENKKNYDNETFEFTSPETGDRIYVRSKKPKKYYQANNKDYLITPKHYEGEKYADYTVAFHDSIVQADSSFIHSWQLRHKKSTKASFIKSMMSQGRSIFAIALIDTVDGPSDFVRSFFDNLTILPDPDYIPDPAKLLLDELLSEDKSDLQTCILRFDELEYDSRHLDQLKTLSDSLESISTLADSLYEQEFAQETVLGKIAEVQAPSSLSFIQSFYNKKTDGLSKMEVLQLMANIKTQESYKQIKQLLLEDPPFIDIEYGFPRLVNQLSDSLELCSSFFPDLFELKDLEGYELGLYRLLGNLIEKELISPSKYRAQLPSIARKSLIELRRNLNNRTGERYYHHSSQFSRNYPEYKSYQGALYDYFKILYPHQKKYTKAKEFIEKIPMSKEYKLKMAVLMWLAERDYPISGELRDACSETKESSLKLFERLTEDSLALDVRQSLYSNRKTYFEHKISSRYKLTSKDSLFYLMKDTISNKLGNGVYYFYSTTSEKSEIQTVYFVGPILPNEPYTKARMRHKLGPFDQKELDEKLEQIKKQIRFYKRKRARSSLRGLPFWGRL